MGVLKAKVGGVWVPVGVQGGPNAQVETGSYVPVLTGMAVGTGGSAQNTAGFHYVGGLSAGNAGMLMAAGVIVFGTTGPTFPGVTCTVSPPPGFAFSSIYTNIRQPIGLVEYVAAGSTLSIGHLRWVAANQARIMLQRTDVAYNLPAATSTTAPATWVAGDQILWTINAAVVRV